MKCKLRGPDRDRFEGRRIMKRPMGVTIIAVLAIIGAVLGMLTALPFLGVTGIGILSGLSGQSGLVALGTSIGLVIGLVWLATAVVQLVLGVGMLQLKSWAWTLGVVLYGAMLALYVISLLTVGLSASVVVGVLVALVIVGYLYSHDVREAFGHLPHASMTSHTPTPSH